MPSCLLNMQKAAAVLPGNGSTDGISFPDLPQRIFHAPAKQSYSCAAVNSQGEFESGFRFADGCCELDVYSNGINEGSNKTGLEVVISAMADVLEKELL